MTVLFWLKKLFPPEIWHGDRSTIHIAESTADNGVKDYIAIAWFQSSKGRSQTFEAKGRSQEEAIENLNKLVEESPNLSWEN